MESKEIIENIGSIYERFKIPPHLQDHMFRAAAVARLICENWIGEGVSEDDVVAVLLLHDLGNVVRMTFDNEDLLLLYGEKSNIDDLKRDGKEAVEKYGSNDHEATDKMCKELGVNERFLFLMNNKAFIQNREICDSNDFEQKICAYADQRIGPRGVLSLRERLDEAIARSGNRPWHLDFDELVGCASKIEEQVLNNVDLSAEDINDDSIKEYLGFNHNNS